MQVSIFSYSSASPGYIPVINSACWEYFLHPFFPLQEFFLSHLSHWLMVSYCVICPSCVVCHQQLLQRTSSPKLLAGF